MNTPYFYITYKNQVSVKSGLEGKSGELGSGVEIKFGHQVGTVTVNGFDAYIQMLRYHPVGHPMGDQPQHIFFPVCNPERGCI